MDKKEGLRLLREVLKCRLAAWDASMAAEMALGVEVNTQSESVEDFMSNCDDLREVDNLDDEEVLEIFELELSE